MSSWRLSLGHWILPFSLVFFPSYFLSSFRSESCRGLSAFLLLLERNVESSERHFLCNEMHLVTAFACGVRSFVSLSYSALGQGSSRAWRSTANACFNAASCASLYRWQSYSSHICKPKAVLQLLYSEEKGAALGMHLPGFNLQHLKLPYEGFPSIWHLPGGLDLKHT